MSTPLDQLPRNLPQLKSLLILGTSTEKDVRRLLEDIKESRRTYHPDFRLTWNGGCTELRDSEPAYTPYLKCQP